MLSSIPAFVTDKGIQFTALTWMKTVLSLAQRSMMVFTSSILLSILPSVAYDSDKSRIFFPVCYMYSAMLVYIMWECRELLNKLMHILNGSL